jgi:hypothetical protein
MPEEKNRLESVMKRLLCVLFCFAVLLAAPSWSLAAADREATSFAVLPFQIHGPEKYHYLGEGIRSMLESRLFREGRFAPVDKSSIQSTSADIDSKDRARRILDGLQAQYLFWGEVTVFSEQASVDLRILEAGEPIRSMAWEASLNDLIPSVRKQAQRINREVFKVEAKTRKRETDQAAKEAGETGISPSRDIRERGRASGEIVQTGSRDRSGVWRSRRFNFESKGALVGDADGDGENEIFVLSEDAVHAVEKRGDRLERIAEYTASRRLKCLTIDLIDLNGDGAQEIAVSAIRDEEKMQSFILDFSGGAFQVLEEGISRFLNVVRPPPEYEPVLLAQKFNPSRMFYGQVHRLGLASEEVREEERVQLPNKVNVSNLAYLPVQDGYKLIFVGTFNKLRVLDQEGKVQHVSSEKYALSTTKLPEDASLPGLEQGRGTEKYHYIPARMLPGDFNGDGQHELLVNRNISKWADLLPKSRHYPQGAVHSLYWDGIGLSQEWKTKPIQGTVIDYGIKDVDNDGSRKLYVCVNTYPGVSNFEEVKTMIVSYSLAPIAN